MGFRQDNVSHCELVTKTYKSEKANFFISFAGKAAAFKQQARMSSGGSYR